MKSTTPPDDHSTAAGAPRRFLRSIKLPTTVAVCFLGGGLAFLAAPLRGAPTTYNVLTHPQSTVVGNGVTKERNAIQAMINLAAQDTNPDGAVVYFPSRPDGQFYNVDVPAGQPFKPLLMKDKVILRGDGPNSNSLLKNPSTDLTTYGRTFVFIWGTAFPTSWANANAYPVGNVSVDDTTVTLQNPSQSQYFAIGGKIRVSDPNYVVYPSGQKTELFGQLFRIMNINPATGTITLSHALRRNLTGAVIHKIEACNDTQLSISPGFGTYKGGIEDMKLESNYRVSARGGAISCSLKRLSVKGFSGVMYGNCWHECTFSNITEQVKAGMELSDCSVGNNLNTITLNYQNQAGWPANTMFVGMQEYSSYNTLEYFTLNLGNENLSNGAIRTLEGLGNRIQHGTINGYNLPTGTSRLLKPYGKYNYFIDLDVNCDSPNYYIDAGDGPGNQVVNVRINDIHSGSTTGTSQIGSTGGLFSGVVQPRGAFHLTTGSSNNTVTNFSNPANIDDDGTDNTIN